MMSAHMTEPHCLIEVIVSGYCFTPASRPHENGFVGQPKRFVRRPDISPEPACFQAKPMK
jgi:hypothetical protein